MSEVIETLYESILEGERDETLEYVQKALDEGVAPDVILNKGMIDAMKEVGQLFEEGEIFVPEMLIAARAMQGGMEILKPHLIESGIEPVGKVILGTVKGDLHDIGKNLVGMMLEGGGFRVIDLGVNVPKETVIEAAITNKADVVGLSALLTTSMPAMAATVAQFKEQELSGKIIVGGAPVTQEFADAIGADGYAPNAPGAVTIAREFIEG